MGNWTDFIPAVLTIGGLVGMVVVSFVGGSVSIGVRGLTFQRNKDPSGEKALMLPTSVFAKIDNEVGEVQSVLYSAFLTALKEVGERDGVPINLRRLDDYEESQHVSLLARVIAYKGNGMESVQTIVTRELKSGRWVGKSVDDYVKKTVMPQTMRTITHGINMLYGNTALTPDGTEIQRVIDKTELWERWQSESVATQIETVVKRFFEYAESVLEG